jgi:hypothetical protein
VVTVALGEADTAKVELTQLAEVWLHAAEVPNTLMSIVSAGAVSTVSSRTADNTAPAWTLPDGNLISATAVLSWSAEAEVDTHRELEPPLLAVCLEPAVSVVSSVAASMVVE